MAGAASLFPSLRCLDSVRNIIFRRHLIPMEDISQIRDLRKKLGITQHGLAKLSGVSQSLIAKIEAGRIDPGYSKAKGIIAALQRQQFSKEKSAKDLMHSGIEAISPDETLHSAASKMRKNSISQLPVAEGRHVVGSITERTIVESFSSRRKGMAGLRVREVMEGAFPTVLPSTPVSAVASLLLHYPAILVMEKGSVAGIITKADLLKAI